MISLEYEMKCVINSELILLLWHCNWFEMFDMNGMKNMVIFLLLSFFYQEFEFFFKKKGDIGKCQRDFSVLISWFDCEFWAEGLNVRSKPY